MDPYYQQQQQQPAPSGQAQQQVSAIGVGQLQHQQMSQQQQQQQQGQRVGDPMMGAGIPAPGGGPQPRVSSYASQADARAQQQVMDAYGGSRSGLGMSGQQHHSSGLGVHHHGGHPPLPPTSGTSHHRYSSSGHRSALHQHRSSAAAISEPMVANTITEQLGSAAGPLTGSGSALNHLGIGGGYSPAGAYYASDGQYYQQQQQHHHQQSGNPRYQQQQQYAFLDSAGGPSLGLGGAQTGNHYPLSGNRASRNPAAYQLERSDALVADSRGYPQSHRTGLGRLDPSTTQLYPAEATRTGYSDGLGVYNPLDDGRGEFYPSAHPLDGQPQLGSTSGAGHLQQQQHHLRDPYTQELRARLQEAQSSYAAVKRELETATQKLGSSMHSIKSFWSPELKKERALRKEEATKYALVNDQMKLMRVEVQKQALLIRQLEEELRLAHETRIRIGDPDIQQHIDALCMEKESLFKENCLLRETIRELEMRIETQKQTLSARDDSIRKMVEMMNNKGIATKIMEDERMEMDRIKARNIELEARLRHYESIIEAKEKDIIKTRPNLPASSPEPLRPLSPIPASRLRQHLKSGRRSSSKAERLKSRLSAGGTSSVHAAENVTFEEKERNPVASQVQMEELRGELAKRDQELLTLGAKMKAQEEQLRDSQRHIHLLKDSLVAKEEHYNLLLGDVDELRRNLDERNKLIERKSYQQTLGNRATGNSGSQLGAGRGYQQQQQDAQELEALLELREKKIADLQRRLLHLDGLLSERDAQLERLRSKLEHQHHSTSGAGGHPDLALLGHLEDTIGDKEKQISLIRDQRDRAEHELSEERDSHERTIKEYKMKLNSVKFEMEKLQNRLSKQQLEPRYGSAGGSQEHLLMSTCERLDGQSSQSSSLQGQLKRLELDKRSLQLECERLKERLESSGAGSRAAGRLGVAGELAELERVQETLEGVKQELRRAQAENRMSELERKRAQEEADKLSERFERAQAELHKLKARMENANSEREQLREDYERQQQLLRAAQTERDCALADINALKVDQERLVASASKSQVQVEKLEAQLERAQLEQRRLEERLSSASSELRQVQSERVSGTRELKALETELQSAQLERQRVQQDRELARLELEKVRERLERLEGELERQVAEKDAAQQQLAAHRERQERDQQLHLAKWTKEREQLVGELSELRERASKQQRQLDSYEQESRSEVRTWREKYERLLGQLERVNEELAGRDKENSALLERLQRSQAELLSSSSRLEQCELERERQAIELERVSQVSAKAKEEYARWQKELAQMQEMYTKTNSKLLKLADAEEKLRIEHDKCQMDLEVLRERYEKLQQESRRLQSERDRLQVEQERARYDNERKQVGLSASSTAAQAGAADGLSAHDDFARLASELERSQAKLEQYQREINKLQLEKERLLLDSKSALQASELQVQQQIAKSKATEEKALVELERARHQVEKLQARALEQERLAADKERLQQQLLLLQQEVDKFRNQQSSSIQETKRLHEEELQRLLSELDTLRDKYSQQRKELLQLRELQQNHQLDKDILSRELESAEARLEKLNAAETRQKQEADRCVIELEKVRDKAERKQQELARAQKERNQFAQEIQQLHQQIQQLQQQQQQVATGQQQPQEASGGQQQQQQQAQVRPEESGKLKQMLLKSESDLQKSLAENQRFQMELERLKLQLDDAAEYIGKIEGDNLALQKQSQEILQELKQVQQQSAPNSQAHEEVRKLQDVIKKSTQEMQKLLDERAKIQEANKELQRQLDQTKAEFSAAMDKYGAELQRLQQQQQQQQQHQQQQATGSQTGTDEYKVKFEKAVEAIRAFQKTSDDMKKEIIKLNERNKSLSEQNQQLMQSLNSTASARRQSTDQVASSGEQQLKQQLAQLSELSVKLESELAKSKDESQQQLQVNQQLKQALDRSSAEFSSLRTERDSLQAQLEKLMQEFGRREDEQAQVHEQQDKHEQNIQAKQNELKAYQKQLEERERALEAKRQELAKQQQPGSNNNQSQQQQEIIGKLQKQVQTLEEEKSKLSGELERVTNELKQSQAELERLLKILSASEEDKFNLTQQIEQLQARLKSASTQVNPHQQQPQQQQQQQQRGPSPQAQMADQQQQQAQRMTAGQQAPQRGPSGQQQQKPAQQPSLQQPQQQQKPAGQRGSGAGGFISGLFQ